MFFISLFYLSNSVASTVYSMCSGYWSDSLIWSTGKVPGATDNVVINHHVLMDEDIIMSPGWWIVKFCHEI